MTLAFCGYVEADWRASSRDERGDRPRVGAGCYAAEVSQTQGPPEDIRRRIAGWRAAELRERQLRRDEPILDPTTALELATELCELAPGLFEVEDPVREREVREARAAWAKLRERLGWPRQVQSQS
jgi:hypothetical protein